MANLRSKLIERQTKAEADRYRANLRASAPLSKRVASESKMLDAQVEAEQQVLLSRRNRRGRKGKIAKPEGEDY